MKKILAVLSVAFGVVAAAATSWAFSWQGECIGCHVENPAVVVTVTPGGCNSGNQAFTVGVSNTNPGSEGWGVFDGALNVKNGYGTFGTFTLPSQKTYTFYGVSGFGTWTGIPAQSSSPASYASDCPSVVCTDNDVDTYSVSGGTCGAVDCNDANSTVYPGATEVVGDGIDQNCNGYDLTIRVTKATWSSKSKKLTVEATSGFGSSANLSVSGIGAMTWSSTKWTLVVIRSTKPATVTVTGFEGSVTAAVTTVK